MQLLLIDSLIIENFIYNFKFIEYKFLYSKNEFRY